MKWSSTIIKTRDESVIEYIFEYQRLLVTGVRRPERYLKIQNGLCFVQINVFFYLGMFLSKYLKMLLTVVYL